MAECSRGCATKGTAGHSFAYFVNSSLRNDLWQYSAATVANLSLTMRVSVRPVAGRSMWQVRRMCRRGSFVPATGGWSPEYARVWLTVTTGM